MSYILGSTLEGHRSPIIHPFLLSSLISWNKDSQISYLMILWISSSFITVSQPCLWVERMGLLLFDESAVNLKDAPLYIISFFDLVALNISPLWFFVIVMRMCLGVFLFRSLLVGTLWAHEYGSMYSPLWDLLKNYFFAAFSSGFHSCPSEMLIILMLFFLNLPQSSLVVRLF